eukprot:SAG22_NODE_6791_length_811_cov_0.783708_1_plen_159_part_10
MGVEDARRAACAELAVMESELERVPELGWDDVVPALEGLVMVEGLWRALEKPAAFLTKLKELTLAHAAATAEEEAQQQQQQQQQQGATAPARREAAWRSPEPPDRSGAASPPPPPLALGRPPASVEAGLVGTMAILAGQPSPAAIEPGKAHREGRPPRP